MGGRKRRDTQTTAGTDFGLRLRPALSQERSQERETQLESNCGTNGRENQKRPNSTTNELQFAEAPMVTQTRTVFY